MQIHWERRIRSSDDKIKKEGKKKEEKKRKRKNGKKEDRKRRRRQIVRRVRDPRSEVRQGRDSFEHARGQGRGENREPRWSVVDGKARRCTQVLSPVWQGAISSVIYSALFLRRDVEITRELIIEARCKLYFRSAIAMIIAMICRRRARTAKLRRSPPFRVTIRFFVRMYTRYVIGIVFGNSRLNFERFVCCRVGRSSSVICREGIAVVARVKQPRHDNRSS